VRYAFDDDFVTGPVITSGHYTSNQSTAQKSPLAPFHSLWKGDSVPLKQKVNTQLFAWARVPKIHFWRKNIMTVVHISVNFLNERHTCIFHFGIQLYVLLSLINQCIGLECCISKWLSKLCESTAYVYDLLNAHDMLSLGKCYMSYTCTAFRQVERL